jgi:MFS family permease
MPDSRVTSPRRAIAATFVAFAAFGAFWGTWGASVPRVRDQAAIGDGRLGFALLFVGAGALPAMLSIGGVLDRWGPRVAALTTVALGTAGAVLALTAVDLTSLCAGLAVTGAASGAGDVAINAVAGGTERIAGRPVITRAHGVFSGSVVLSSLGTGLASAASWPLAVPFAVVAVLSLAAGAALVTALPARFTAEHGERRPDGPPAARPRIVPLAGIGVLGALAFAAENAHQNWSGVVAHDVLHTGTGLSAVGPALFAGTVALGRFGLGGLRAGHERAVLLAGAATATAGAVVIAAAPALPVDALGLAMAGAGTSVLLPTVLGFVSRGADEAHRGRAISVVTAVSYLGGLLGPGYVGLWADAGGLRVAMVAVAALTAAVVALTPVLLRTTSRPAGGGTVRPRPAPPPRPPRSPGRAA